MLILPVYPQKADKDAPYSLSEQQLRSAIFIPKEYTYGKKPPVVLVLATGFSGYSSFSSSMIPLLREASWAEVVLLNLPQHSFADVQANAEHTTYALNYIASLTQRNVSIIAFSQGSIDIQWALKY
ncbi:hypothetical protein CDD81_6423 [Ophiocordyceps australis]|uniref:AB hydrolase-1 domain-containing protein n=1 Tax=Ophiocordyceps australis TaxID=1399860 RepID=A0A2C5XHN7_9HYPO|nr:hypothetical protein CDD81_6423 [Ophiocordyceps australis]